MNSSVIEKVINENGYPDFKYNNNKNAIENIETCIKDREEKQKIKRLIIDRVLKKEDFKSSYIGFVNAIREKMSAL